MKERYESDSRIVGFQHMPKAGGTTLYDAIRISAIGWRVRTVAGNSHIEDSFAELQREVEDCRLSKRWSILRYHDLRELRTIDGNIEYFTFLRNPVDRVSSIYFYLIQSKGHELHPLIKDFSLMDFVESPYAQNNYQFKMLTHLNGGHDNIRFVGVLDHFDASLLLLKDIFEWKGLPFYRIQNQSQRRVLTKEEILKIQKYNRDDIEVYNNALHRIETELEKADFVRKIERFQKYNKKMQLPFKAVGSIRKVRSKRRRV